MTTPEVTPTPATGVKKWVTDIIKSVLNDPGVQQWIKNLLSSIITEKIAPLIPLAVGAAVHGIVQEIPGVKQADAAVDSAVAATEKIRQDLNKAIPDIDIGIPAIDNIFDVWRPKP